jgi:hypothetical protein
MLDVRTTPVLIGRRRSGGVLMGGLAEQVDQFGDECGRPLAVNDADLAGRMAVCQIEYVDFGIVVERYRL